MESVVQTLQSTVVQGSPATTNIVTTNNSTVKVETTNTSIITQATLSNIVIESVKSEVILAGALGPAGLTAEDAEVYSKRIDFITDNELYKGEAAVGSSESSSVWRIRKITIAGDSDITEVWASGTSTFDKIWANRAALIYS